MQRNCRVRCFISVRNKGEKSLPRARTQCAGPSERSGALHIIGILGMHGAGSEGVGKGKGEGASRVASCKLEPCWNSLTPNLT